MPGVAGQQIEGMLQQWRDGSQRGDGPGRIPGKIQHEGLVLVDSPADPAAQGGQQRFFAADGAHELRYPIQQPVADGPGCLRGYIPGGDASAAGRYDQPRPGGGEIQCVFNSLALVWY